MRPIPDPGMGRFALNFREMAWPCRCRV
jgi:hypothetical protein